MLPSIDRPPVIAEIADALVDERVGIVNAVFDVRLQAGAPKFFHVAARACNTGAFTSQDSFTNTGGASTVRERAIVKAIGEAVERYCAAIFDVDDYPLFSYADAPGDAVAPAEFALYSDRQYDAPGFPWMRFEDDTTVRWIAALDLGAGAPCWVPACRVWIPYHYYLGSGDGPIDQPISTGVACHETLDLATLSGICEVVERDAFTICWQAMMGPPQIRLDTLDDEGYDLVERFRRAGVDVTMFDLTLDHGIPTVLSVARSTAPGAPAFVFAASTAPSPRTAVRSSLEELAHTRRYSQWIKEAMAPAPHDRAYRTVQGQEDHLNFAADHANAARFEFLFSSDERRSFDELPDLATGDAAEEVALLVERIVAVGGRVLAVDVTSDDVRELGLRVVRAIVPQFHPLHLGHELRACGGTRLWQVPQSLGYAGADPETDGNPTPHPYP